MKATRVATLLVSLGVVVSHHSTVKKTRTCNVRKQAFDGIVWWEHSTYARRRKSKRRRSEQSNTGPSSLDAYNIWFRSAGTSPWSSGNVLCGQNLGVDSPGSQRLATAGCAVQEKEDERRWRPAQEQRTDGRKDFTCAVCVFVEKRARKRQNSVAVVSCSTLCSVAPGEDAVAR